MVTPISPFYICFADIFSGKEFHSSKLYVFRLADFEDEDEEPKSRPFCRNHRVDKSRGKQVNWFLSCSHRKFGFCFSCDILKETLRLCSHRTG